MKIISLIVLFISFYIVVKSQTNITINVPNAGIISTAITAAGGDASTMTNLTVSGNIDARDMKFLRDSMPKLSVIDIINAQIKHYQGTEGTGNGDIIYPADELPVWSFINDTSIVQIMLPKSITSIGEQAFSKCINLSGSLVIPENVTTIGFGAYAFCTKLSGQLVIPLSVTQIGDGVFYRCGFTGSPILSNNITRIGDEFGECIGLTGDVIVPNKVTTILNGFTKCSNITACYLSVSLTSFRGFSRCTGLQKIVINKQVPLSIDQYSFRDVNKSTCELIVPMGSKAAYETTDYWSTFSNITEAFFVNLETQGDHPAAPITTTQINTTIESPKNPKRKGFTFAGWYKESDCLNQWNFDTDIVTEPITLYAKWIEETYEETVTDIDGNIYNTVTIGEQVWMKENLKTSQNSNGESIQIYDNAVRYGIKTPAFCWYNNDSVAYAEHYGALYNWYAVNSGNLCPSGWHVPTDAEWIELEVFLQNNDFNFNGIIDNDNDRETNNYIAKSVAANSGWPYWYTEGVPGNPSHESYINKSGLSVIPAGYALTGFSVIDNEAHFWTNSEADEEKAWAREIHSNGEGVWRLAHFKGSCMSVRCIKNSSGNSIGKIPDSEIKVYPNPALNTLYISCNSKTDVAVSIFNLQGKQVFAGRLKSNSIDISHLRKGIYMVKVIAGEKSIITKLIKE